MAELEERKVKLEFTTLTEMYCINYIMTHLRPYCAENIYNLRSYFICLDRCGTFLKIWRLFKKSDKYDEYKRKKLNPAKIFFFLALLIEINKAILNLRKKTFDNIKSDLENLIHNAFINAMQKLIDVGYMLEKNWPPMYEFIAPLMESMLPDVIPRFKVKLITICRIKRRLLPQSKKDDWFFEYDPKVIEQYSFNFILELFFNTSKDSHRYYSLRHYAGNHEQHHVENADEQYANEHHFKHMNEQDVENADEDVENADEHNDVDRVNELRFIFEDLSIF